MFGPRSLAWVCVALCAAPLYGQSLLRDFNTEIVSPHSGSLAVPVATLANGDLLVTTHRTPSYTELWRTDGTAAGTTPLADLRTGPSTAEADEFVALPSGLVVFRARTPAAGAELWVTDGTPMGTRQLADIRPGPYGSEPRRLTSVGNRVVFFADDGVRGYEPWQTDGTVTGTALVTELFPGAGGGLPPPRGVTAMGASRFACLVEPRGGPSGSLWISDLTAAGTYKVANVLGGFSLTRPVYLSHFGGRLAWVAPQGGLSSWGLWFSDGTAEGTIASGFVGGGPVAVEGSRMWFRGAEKTPWVTDGTAAGTRPVFVPSLLTPNLPVYIGALGGRMLFVAWDRLYSADGTTGGVRQLASMRGGFASSVRSARFGGELYFGADTAPWAPRGVWKTDGTATGTIPLFANVSGQQFFTCNGRVVFSGRDHQHGRELWRSDGSPAGTQIFADLQPTQTLSSDCELLATLRDRVVFQVDDGVHDRQLWITDGTAAGIWRISDLTGGIGSATVTSNDAFLFIRFDEPALAGDPWVSDGTLSGLQRLQMGAQHAGFQVGSAVPIGPRMLFEATTAASGSELWVSDGTLAGTVQVVDLVPGSGGSEPGDFLRLGRRAVFLATTAASGREPWISDGTLAGTVQLADVAPGTAGISRLEGVVVGDRLYFHAPRSNGHDDLWVTDGAPGGTRQVAVGPGTSELLPEFLQPLGDDRLLCHARSLDLLVATDGTAAGTVTYSLPIVPKRIARLDAAHALVLGRHGLTWIGWSTDGTAIGSMRLGPLLGRSSGYYTASNPTDDKLVLELNTASFGMELFVFDGSPGGVRPLVAQPPRPGETYELMRAGTRLVMTSQDDVHGRELHGVDLRLVDDETFAEFGYGCPGTAGVTPQITVEGEADGSAIWPFQVVISRGQPAALTILVLGSAPVAVSQGGCTLWTGGQIGLVFGATDTSGVARFPLPTAPSLVGRRFVAQGYVADPQGGLAGLAALTAGLEFVYGP